MSTGRGAWTEEGGTKPYGNGSGFYALYEPAVGSQYALDPSIDPAAVDFGAVNWGVKAIQRRCMLLIGVTIPVDGWFGSQTAEVVKSAQRALRLTDDGVVGPATGEALWRPLIVSAEQQRTIPRHSLFGIVSHESGFDPGAVGATTSEDGGLVQAHRTPRGVTSAQAFSPNWSLSWAADRFEHAYYVDFIGKGATLRLDCSIAQHNSPVAAWKWYNDGRPPNESIATYVSSVKNDAAAF